MNLTYHSTGRPALTRLAPVCSAVILQMSVEEYLNLMRFPVEWREWGMLPEAEFLNSLIASYKPGMENASEHDRNGVFHWWLKREPTEAQLISLAKLTLLDPDPLMAGSVKNHIRKAAHYSGAVEAELSNAK